MWVGKNERTKRSKREGERDTRCVLQNEIARCSLLSVHGVVATAVSATFVSASDTRTECVKCCGTSNRLSDSCTAIRLHQRGQLPPISRSPTPFVFCTRCDLGVRSTDRLATHRSKRNAYRYRCFPSSRFSFGSHWWRMRACGYGTCTRAWLADRSAINSPVDTVLATPRYHGYEFYTG